MTVINHSTSRVGSMEHKDDDDDDDLGLGLGLGLGLRLGRSEGVLLRPKEENEVSHSFELSFTLCPKNSTDHGHGDDSHLLGEEEGGSCIKSMEEAADHGKHRCRIGIRDDPSSIRGGRKKLRLTKEESKMLEDCFKLNATLDPLQKKALAEELKLRPRQVEVWFQNRRARTKLKQTEEDCELLKKCCERLNDENTRLKKELQELRSYLATQKSPFLLPLPANLVSSAAPSLSICPSCQLPPPVNPNQQDNPRLLRCGS